KEVVIAQPSSAAAHLVLGNLYLRRADPAQAIGPLTRALELNPNQAGARFSLGLAYQEKGDPDTANATYRKGIELDGKDPRLLNNLAWLLVDRGRNLDEALTLAKKANELSPGSAAILDTLGWVHYTRGAYAEAEPVVRKAVELAPDNATTQYHAGMIYYRVGRKDDATFALRRSLQLDPKLP